MYWEMMLQSVQSQAPLVLNITNDVAMERAANTLLAVGASPLMSSAIEEIPELVGFAACSVINIGTLNANTIPVMLETAKMAQQLGKPWILDPVGAGATKIRLETCRQLMAFEPTIIRGNASEILALAGLGSGGKGVDATDSMAGMKEHAEGFALSQKMVVVATGEIDLITDGTTTEELVGGHDYVTRLTATGCALSAMMGAFVPVAENPLEAAVGACQHYKRSARLASTEAKGVGSFAMHFADQLAR